QLLGESAGSRRCHWGWLGVGRDPASSSLRSGDDLRLGRTLEEAEALVVLGSLDRGGEGQLHADQLGHDAVGLVPSVLAVRAEELDLVPQVGGDGAEDTSAVLQLDEHLVGGAVVALKALGRDDLASNRATPLDQSRES